MFIRDLLWDDINIEHVADHRVAPDEVEDVCYGGNLIQNAGGGKHAVLGQTLSGRYLLVVVADKGSGRFRVVTARDMTTSERRRFLKSK